MCCLQAIFDYKAGLCNINTVYKQAVRTNYQPHHRSNVQIVTNFVCVEILHCLMGRQTVLTGVLLLALHTLQRRISGVFSEATHSPAPSAAPGSELHIKIDKHCLLDLYHVNLRWIVVCNYHSLKVFASICRLELNSINPKKKSFIIYINHCFPKKAATAFLKLPSVQMTTWGSKETLTNNGRRCWAAWGDVADLQQCCTEQCSCRTEPLNLKTAAEEPRQESLQPHTRSLLTSLKREKQEKFADFFLAMCKCHFKENTPPDCVRCNKAQVALCCTCGS